MKKIFIIVAFLLMSVVSFAQTKNETLPTPYPSYGLFSNVSVGVDGGLTFNKLGDSTFHGCGFDVYFERPLSYVFDARLSIGIREKSSFDKMYVPVTGAIKINWIDMFMKNKRAHRFEIYSLVGMGAGYNVDNYFENESLGNFVYDGFGGLGLGYTFGKNYDWKVRLESKVDGVTDCGKWNGADVYQYTTLNVQYNLGLTKVDRQRMEMLAMLKAERDSIVAHNGDAVAALNSCQENNARLENILKNHICCQERFDSIIRVKDSTIDSLNNVLNGIKDGQLNNYSLPFSVMFDLDSYKIKSSEYSKLNQIAKYMKDDGGKFKLVGFASSDGSDEYNMNLSKKRVEAVMNYLKKKGVDEDNMEMDNKGESVVFGEGESSINRRVSFYKSL